MAFRAPRCLLAKALRLKSEKVWHAHRRRTRQMKALCRNCGPALLLMTLVPASAVAQSLPAPNPSTGNIDVSASEGVFDLGTRFLRRLANGYAGGGSNPQGGGGPAVATPPRYRSWVEGYGLTARTGAQDTFTGDKRTTWGVIGG